MNYTIIILGIVLVVLLYLLYLWITSKTKQIVSYTNLNIGNPPITTLTNPTSANYGYGIWIYVNTWDASIDKYIYGRNKNIGLRLAKTQPVLMCDFYMNDGTFNTVKITNSFPIQRWVYVIISVDSQFIDCYLDGKLVTSTKLSKLPLLPGDKSVPLILGGSVSGDTQTSDTYIASFYQFTQPVDPQTAWNYYMKGNGQSMMFGTYGADLTLLKNNVEYSNYRLF